MERDILTFEGGLFPQFSPGQMPKGTYRYAMNMVRDDSGSLINEGGTKKINSFTDTNLIVGMTVLGSDLIICYITQTGVPGIGILDVNDVFEVKFQTSTLGWDATMRLQMESRFWYNGDRIVYIVGEGITPRRINLDFDYSVIDPGLGDPFDRVTSLFLEYTAPRTTFNQVVADGSVLTGVYQFTTRLLTQSGNYTGFGNVTGIIPVGDETFKLDGSNRKTVDGAPPQSPSNNAISLTIDKIDPTYSAIEISVITYVGTGNVREIHALYQIPINGRTEIDFIYTGQSQERDSILEEEIDIDQVLYTEAKYISQKDNTLQLAGLKEFESQIDWQAVANSIVIFPEFYARNDSEFSSVYSEERDAVWDDLTDKLTNARQGIWRDISDGGGGEGYKNPKTCESFMSYKRDEVYSFTITPVFKSGRRGYAYHIPGRPFVVQGPGEPNSLDPAYSNSNNYPEGFPPLDDGTVLENTPVAYHRMPKDPFYTVSGDTVSIQVLGLKFVIQSTLPWEDEISGYIIGREKRQGFETRFGQGVVKAMYPTVSPRDGRWFPSPGFGYMRITGTDGNNHTDRTTISDVMFTYHSPELLFTSPPASYQRIKQIYTSDLKYRYACTENDGVWNPEKSFLVHDKSPVWPALGAEPTSEIVDSILLPSESDDPEKDTQADAGFLEKIVFSNGYIIHYRRISECLLMLTNSGELPLNTSDAFAEEFEDKASGSTKAADYHVLVEEPVNALRLYEMERDLPGYYGDIYNKTSYPITQIYLEDGSFDARTGQQLPNNEAVVFGGDIFISRFALTFQDTVPGYGSLGSEFLQNIPKVDSTIYFFTESIHNFNYRHYISTAEEQTPPYYPKFRVLQGYKNVNEIPETPGINDTLAYYGPPKDYNYQYSAENTLRANVTGSLFSDILEIYDFPNRIVYSDTSVEGENYDAYRVFLPGNYHDIPRQYGFITGLFVHNYELMVHTERCLWRSFYNSLASQATSEGEIVLGNGGAFNRPSVPMLTIEGGYAGCKDISASVQTPQGRYFLDTFRSKFYYLGEGLQEISNPAIFDELRKKAYNVDSVLGYDYGRKRILMSSENLSLTFAPEHNSWSSYHTWRFRHAVSRDIDDYISPIVPGESASKYGLYKWHEQNPGVYMDDITKDAMVTLVSYVSPLFSKRFVGLDAVSETFMPDLGDKYIPYSFFNKMRVRSWEVSTGWTDIQVQSSDQDPSLEVFGQVKAHKANNKFRIPFAPNIQIDVNEPTVNPDGSDIAGNLHVDWNFRPDLIDRFVLIDMLKQNNLASDRTELHGTIVNFDINIT